MLMHRKFLLWVSAAAVAVLLAMALLTPDVLSRRDAVIAGAIGAMAILIAAIGALEFAIRMPLARALRSDEDANNEGLGHRDPLLAIAALKRALSEQRQALAAERKRWRATEDVLRATEERYEIAVRSAPDGSWEWDIDDNRFVLSARWKGMLGFEPAQIPDTRQAYIERVHPDERDRVTSALNSLRTGTIGRFEHEHRMRNKDGVWRWVLSRGCALHHANGRPYRVIGLDIDITRARRVEDALIRVAEQTAGLVGNDYFRSLVRTFAQALDWQGALITECTDHTSSVRMRVLAFWCDGEFVENFEYELSGSACEEVICRGEPYFVASGVGGRHPQDAQWEAYLGLPIRGTSGRIVGHLAFVDRRRMSDEAINMPIYQSLVARAAIELERRSRVLAQVD